MPPLKVRQQAGEYERTHKDASIVSSFIAGYEYAQQESYLDATMVDDTPVYDDAPNIHPDQDKLAVLNKRKFKFGKSLIPYVDEYGQEMIRSFFDYWSEFNRSKTKMKFELEKTWELPRRLAYWKRRTNERTFNNGNKSTEQEKRFSAYATAISNVGR